jgi:hypothetical protein
VHAALHFPAEVPDVEVFRLIRKQGVGAVPVSSICWHARGHNGLALGYGGAEPAQIDVALAVIGDALRRVRAAADSGVVAAAVGRAVDAGAGSPGRAAGVANDSSK